MKDIESCYRKWAAQGITQAILPGLHNHFIVGMFLSVVTCYRIFCRESVESAI